MENSDDKFIQMVTAKAEVNLKLSDFEPLSMLSVPFHKIEQAKFPAVDYHNHLDAQNPREVLQIMDSCNIEKVVNITMQIGEKSFEMHRKFKYFASDRFETYAWFDWSDLHSDNFGKGRLSVWKVTLNPVFVE